MLSKEVDMQDTNAIYDIAVVGAGINGVGIANDAVGRGLNVFVCEKDDLASHTSSASSKLIHGGLRYLEQKEFRLVREALLEREVLLKKAPHLIHPMRFIMPHQPYLRPAWLIRSGLFIYDYLAKRETLEGSELIYFNADSPLKETISRGFEYSDCTVDDARLVVVNALQAHELGAQIRTQTRCVSATQQEGVWCLTLEHQKQQYQIKARVLVNATGAWVTDFIQQQLLQTPKAGIRLVQGSHIVVKRLYPEHHAFILQNDDQRIVFVIPYLDEYSLIGTTDLEFEGDPNHVQITEQETAYLIDVINDHFKLQLQLDDVISTYAGVRALYDDESAQASKITRDYVLALSNEGEHEAPLLTVYGGKLTTYRKLAEAALSQLKRYFPQMKAEWTLQAKLPGAEDFDSVELLRTELMQSIQGLDLHTAQRWAKTYGCRVWQMLDEKKTMQDLGQSFGYGLYQQEVDYLYRVEWARHSQDILWRRTKLGMKLNIAEVRSLDMYLHDLHQRRVQGDAA